MVVSVTVNLSPSACTVMLMLFWLWSLTRSMKSCTVTIPVRSIRCEVPSRSMNSMSSVESLLVVMPWPLLRSSISVSPVIGLSIRPKSTLNTRPLVEVMVMSGLLATIRTPVPSFSDDSGVTPPSVRMSSPRSTGSGSTIVLAMPRSVAVVKPPVSPMVSDPPPSALSVTTK